MAKRINPRDVGEDGRRIRMAQHMFGYAFRFQGEPEPESLEAAVAAAREILAQPVTMVEPPEGTNDFYVEFTDWQRPPKAVRAFARQLVEAVEQAPVTAAHVAAAKGQR